MAVVARATSTRGGADRRVSALTAELARHIGPADLGVLRVPTAARAAHLAARRAAVPRVSPPRPGDRGAVARPRAAHAVGGSVGQLKGVGEGGGAARPACSAHEPGAWRLRGGR